MPKPLTVQQLVEAAILHGFTKSTTDYNWQTPYGCELDAELPGLVKEWTQEFMQTMREAVKAG